MKKVRFLHCADTHLDMPFATLGTDEKKRNKRREELKACFAKICSLAKQEAVDALLIAGDLYEHRYIRKSTMDFITKELAGLSPIPVFICSGNHDPYIGGSYYKEFLQLPHVFLYGEGGKFEIPEKDTVIYGQGFTDFYKDGLKLGMFQEVDPQKINLFVTHGSLNIDIGKNKYNPLYLSQLQSLQMDYIALGHFHNRVDDSTRNRLVFNPGSPEPLGFDETGEHGVYLVDITKSNHEIKKDIRFIPTQQRRYHRFSVDVSGLYSQAQCMQKIETILHAIAEMDLINIQLRGFRAQQVAWDIQAMKKSLSRFFHVSIEDDSSLELSFDAFREDRSIRGEFVRKMLSMIQSCQDDKERKNLVNALHIGVECLEHGQVELEKYFPIEEEGVFG